MPGNHMNVSMPPAAAAPSKFDIVVKLCNNMIRDLRKVPVINSDKCCMDQLADMQTTWTVDDWIEFIQTSVIPEMQDPDKLVINTLKIWLVEDEKVEQVPASDRKLMVDRLKAVCRYVPPAETTVL